MVGGDSRANLFEVLVDRCRSLEANQVKLREEFKELAEERRKSEAAPDSGEEASVSGCGMVSGYFSDGSPYRRMLESMGVAIHVCAASSGEIVYWNRSAEILYGWRSCEILGKKAEELIVAEEYHGSLVEIRKGLCWGKSWSGQFPLRKRSGEIFMAMMSKSPLYEKGELTGFITVSSDSEIFNKMNPESYGPFQQHHNKGRGPNSKKNQWHPPRPQISSVPQIASSVSNLASRFLQKRQGDDACTSSRGENDAAASEDRSEMSTEEVKLNSKFHDERSTDERGRSVKNDHTFNFPQRSKIAARFLAKLHIRRTNGDEDDKDSASDTLMRNGMNNEPGHRSHGSVAENSAVGASSKGCKGSDTRLAADRDCMPGLGCQLNSNEVELEEPNMDSSEAEDGIAKLAEGNHSSSLGECNGSHGSTSSKGENESKPVVDCEIQWEDLLVGEEIGQGSFAAVYRGIWNGSDIAVKVYFGNEYSEETLEDYKKEIAIMKQLRHPNVLLFMGAVYSPEHLAIVTEFMPRGSLFKTLHKNNQALDIRRRLKMSLDVARGMNYLHHRNPPIVHRDLKSSNLFVDRNWTVKVGDFGLSRWKNATFITAKSGRGGTPQWMAPEVLRNEPSNEKSDVYSFGVILWELMTVSIPWNHLNSLQVVGVVGFMDRRLELPENLDPHIACIISDCWHSDPQQRPSFEDIIHRMTTVVQRSAPARKTSEPLT